jgi:hypothetical protein
MHVIRTVQAFQGHPVPDRVTRPRGPFPPELFVQPEIVNEYDPAFNEDGDGFEPGSTAQNNFTPPKWLRCYDCHERVREDETEFHICEEL